MKYAEVFTKVRRLLNDVYQTPRWPDSALRGYAGTVLRRMGEVAPSSMSMISEITLVEGARQPLPPFALRFLGAISNAAGGTIRNVFPQAMDNYFPGWRSEPPTEMPTDCVYDKNTPGEFHVYPPALPETKITARIVLKVSDPGDSQEEIPINPVNEVALIHGLLALCYSENTDTNDLQLASQHWSQFFEALGVQSAVDAQNPPLAKTNMG
jgi:hypothetical protein